MSGSDPSVRRGGQGGVGEGDCPGQEFQTVLGSPNPDVVPELTVGQLLEVASVDEPARGVVLRTLEGDLVGHLVRDIVRIRRCVSHGHSYEADVVRVAGGSVTVLIRPM